MTTLIIYYETGYATMHSVIYTKQKKTIVPKNIKVFVKVGVIILRKAA